MHYWSNTIMKSLIIRKSSDQIISKEAEEFNKLISKIEKLKEKNILKNNELENCLDYFSKKGIRIIKENSSKRFEFALLLFKLFDSNIVSSGNDKDVIAELLLYQLNQIESYYDIYIPPAYEAFEKEVRTHPAFVLDKEDVETAAFLIRDELEEMGIDLDIDFEGWIKNGGTIEDLQQKIKDAIPESDRKQFYESQEKSRNRQPKKSTKKVKETQLVEKNLNDLYRQLARVFHPDLETDELKRGAKEELMKELNSAYESKNIYAMLQMEIQWFAESHDRLEKLPEEKLGAFVLSLKEQVKILNAEFKEIPNHPKYNILHKATFPYYCDSIPTFYTTMNGLELDSKDLMKTIASLGDGTNRKIVKQFLKEIKMVSRMMPFGY